MIKDEEDGKILYFAYGSNMHWGDWSHWCEKRGENPKGLVEVGIGWLPDYSLLFHYHSTGRNGGAADLSKIAPGSAAPGVLFEVDPQTLQVIDKKEGHPNYYRRVWVDVMTPDGEFVRAITYLVVPEKVSETHIAPTDEYVDLIRTGLTQRDLPVSDLENAVVDGGMHFPIKDIFVYGTLREGEVRHNLIERLGGTKISNATCENAVLYNLGTFPGMTTGHGIVTGEIYRFNDMFTVLQELDWVEGAAPHGKLYRRHIMKVQSDSRSTWVWVYLYNGKDMAEIIDSGDWLNR